MGTDADKHRYFEDMAVAHVLGGLDEADGQVFRSHLLQCPDCRAHVGELRALAHDLADVERDERRVRAAKSVETKRRQDGDGDGEDGTTAPPAPPARLLRLIALVAVLLLVGLAAWNLALRSTVASQQARVATVTDAAALLEFGEEVPWISSSDDLEVAVKTQDQRLVLLVVGLPDAVYGIYQLNHDDEVVASQPVEVLGERLHYLVPLRDDAHQLVVTRARSGLPDEPTGTALILATLP